MNSTLALPAPGPLGYEELNAADLAAIEGGALIPVWLYGAGAYVGATLVDHWGAFKEGVAEGFRAVAG